MSDATPNDDEMRSASPDQRPPDAHGQAAMLLVESLIHGLIESSVITVPRAVEIVATAAEVKEIVADELGDTATTLGKSLALLTDLQASLQTKLLPG